MNALPYVVWVATLVSWVVMARLVRRNQQIASFALHTTVSVLVEGRVYFRQTLGEAALLAQADGGVWSTTFTVSGVDVRFVFADERPREVDA